jgi:hypothetical protein
MHDVTLELVDESDSLIEAMGCADGARRKRSGEQAEKWAMGGRK